MENSINTTSPYLSGYAVDSISPNTVDKLASGSEVQKVSNDPTGLTVTDGVKLHERALSQAIANSTGGIALANIAQEAISEQINIFKGIQEFVSSASNEMTNQNDRQLIAQNIEGVLQNFDSITNETNYNGEVLLKTDGTSDDDLSIVEEKEIVPISKVDTPSLSNNLRNALNEFVANPASRETLLTEIDTGLKKLESFSNDFATTSERLESSIRSQLTETTDDATSKSTVAEIDYSTEVSDFSKTNLLTQAGYLMQTQANAHQQRTINILK